MHWWEWAISEISDIGVYSLSAAAQQITPKLRGLEQSIFIIYLHYFPFSVTHKSRHSCCFRISLTTVQVSAGATVNARFGVGRIWPQAHTAGASRVRFFKGHWTEDLS